MTEACEMKSPIRTDGVLFYALRGAFDRLSPIRTDEAFAERRSRWSQQFKPDSHGWGSFLSTAWSARILRIIIFNS